MKSSKVIRNISASRCRGSDQPSPLSGSFAVVVVSKDDDKTSGVLFQGLIWQRIDRQPGSRVCDGATPAPSPFSFGSVAQRRGAGPELNLVELPIQAVSGQQLILGAFLNDSALIEHNYSIGSPNCR